MTKMIIVPKTVASAVPLPTAARSFATRRPKACISVGMIGFSESDTYEISSSLAPEAPGLY